MVDVGFRLVGVDRGERIVDNASLAISYEGEVVVERKLDVMGDENGSGEKGEDFVLEDVSIPNPKLWWPATMGSQPLYDVTVSFGDETYSWKAGVRKVDTYIDEKTKGRGFKVNGEKVRM